MLYSILLLLFQDSVFLDAALLALSLGHLEHKGALDSVHGYDPRRADTCVEAIQSLWFGN